MLWWGGQCAENEVTELEAINPILRVSSQTGKVECRFIKESGDWGDGAIGKVPVGGLRTCAQTPAPMPKPDGMRDLGAEKTGRLDWTCLKNKVELGFVLHAFNSSTEAEEEREEEREAQAGAEFL